MLPRAARCNWVNGVVSARFKAIYKAGNDAWNGLKNAASNAWNWIKGVWGGAVGWFQGIWNSIAGAAGNLAQRISNAIGGAFSGLAGIVRGAVNWLIDRANNVIGAFNNASGKVGLPSVGQIPRLFQGVNGFLGGSMGGLALVGEQGPELLRLPNGSDVFTADRTRQMLHNGGSNSTQMIINVNNPVVTSSIEGERFAEVIGDNLIRRLGGQTRMAMR